MSGKERTPERQEADFWRRVNRTDTCWPWTGWKNASGYGGLRFAGTNRLAHRVSWMLHNGPIPEGMHVCHTCDSPACVRPGHLFLGTDADNHADKVRKGRQPQGMQNTLGRHAPEKIALIRQLLSEGGRLDREIANMTGVSKTTVHRLRHNQTRRLA